MFGSVVWPLWVGPPDHPPLVDKHIPGVNPTTDGGLVGQLDRAGPNSPLPSLHHPPLSSDPLGTAPASASILYNPMCPITSINALLHPATR